MSSLFRQNMPLFQLVEALPELSITKTKLLLPSGHMTQRLKNLSRRLLLGD